MKIKKLHFLFAGLIISATSLGQKQPSISLNEISQTINFLASDEMKGRKTGSPEIEKAAGFIAASFKKAGLQPLTGNSFLQSFAMVSAKQTSLSATNSAGAIDPKRIIALTSEPELQFSAEKAAQATIKAGENFFSKAMGYASGGKPVIVLVDSSFADRFNRLAFLKRNFFKTGYPVVFILGNIDLKGFSVHAAHDIEEKKLANVVGVLPGKSLKSEYVIFSAHYDHIGIGQPENGDSIYNGANDDASGTTAVMALAKYYAKQKNNSRTLIFAAFTAEESGGFGSQYFSKQLLPEQAIAMFNIEMIGTDSKWGKNSAYITGFEKTNMGAMLQANLKESHFTFRPDPYPDQQLFYRSDNATLARLGVPAHTISTSKMDIEPHYHKASDEVKTLDLENMTAIIEAIAISAKSIISGKDTPSRVDTSQLR
ncbi:M28 family peptidase [Niabella insulamsoli]|uniref:M28 family peptidase n=1 Tax=Niabella insulamsoli TaxID=3144874 RepID=UPI0031FBF9B0